MLGDLRFALRALRATPGFTAVALIVLTLGIGATTAIFSVVDGVALRGLPFPADARLMDVTEINPTNKGLTGGSVAAPNFLDWRAQQTVFEDLAAVQNTSGFTVRDGGVPESLRTVMASSSLFGLLRVSPAIGHAFTAQNEVRGDEHVAVISDGLWHRRFGADPNVVGKTITFDTGVWEVVGVMPAGFTYPIGLAKPTDLWVPYIPSVSEVPRGDGSSRTYNAKVVGRLKDGVTIEQARAQMEQITAALKQQYPKWFRDRWVAVTPLRDSIVGKARSWMLMLLGAVAFVLLIACVNVANLLLARSTARAREVALRTALGATSWQLARGLLAESLVLSAAGTALGVLAAVWGVHLIRASLPPSLPRLSDVGVNLRVLAAAASAAIAVAIGVTPIWQSRRVSLASALREGGRSGAAGAARQRARTILLVAEVALAVILLVGAGLFVSSFVRLMNVDLGLDYSNVVTVDVYPRIDFNAPKPELDAAMARTGEQIRTVLDRVRALPGVQTVAAMGSGSTPLSTGWSRTTVTLPGKPPFDDPDDQPDIKQVTPEYFTALRVPLLKGRTIATDDLKTGVPAVVVINDVAARRFFADQDPIGAPIKANGDRTVIGVVRASRVQGPEGQLRPEVYTPMNWQRAFGGTIIARTPGDPAAIIPALRAAVHASLPELVVPNPVTLADSFDQLIVQRRFNMIVLALFGVLAVVIAGAGIYGVMAYIVEQRTQEIGVRMALGAQPIQVIRMVLTRATMFMAMGLALGILGGWMLSRLIKTFLFAVEPHDPVIYISAALVLMAAGLTAAFVPARRASRVDPVTALR
jgi:putative ABC transport system permease protein